MCPFLPSTRGASALENDQKQEGGCKGESVNNCINHTRA